MLQILQKQYLFLYSLHVSTLNNHHVRKYILFIFLYLASRDGVVGIATRYGLEGPGIESRCCRDVPHLSRPAPRPTQPPVKWVRAFPESKGGRGVVLITHPIYCAKVHEKE
jgi:hypothetical protein